MARIRFLLLLALLVLGGLLAAPAAQTLSSQVLQLLARTNTWTAQQTFQNFRLSLGSPSDTSNRLYNISGALYWNGALVSGGGGGGSVHNLLSATHGDTTVGTVVRGDVLVGIAGPTWSRLGLGAAGTFLRSTGTDVAWGTDGSALTALNASQLSSGTIPLARITNLTNTQIDAAAGIVWTKIDKTGSSLADLSTRSAGDLTSGTLADARLSANVSLFGSAVDNAEVTNATLTFSKWADNGCAAGQYPQWGGAAWGCATVTPGAGTVTSVGLAAPAIFSVAGSPVTGSGTLSFSLATQTANLVWAGPSTGSPAAPSFRSLVYADLPTSAAAAGTYPKVTINAQGIVTGVTSQITLTTDVTGVLPLANGGTGLNAAADDSVLLSNGSAWAAAALSNCTTGLTYTTATNTFGCAGSVGTHALLSASHSDTLAASVVRGDLIIGSSVPQWNRLAIGANGTVLRSNGSDPAWTAVLADLSQILTNSALSVGVYTGSQYAVRINNSLTPWLGAPSATTGVLAGLRIDPTWAAGAPVGGVFANLYIASPPTYTSKGVNLSYAIYVDDGPVYLADGFLERSRTVAAGEWTDVAFSAGNFTANGTMTWTVAAGDVVEEAVMEIGTTQFLALHLITTTVGGVVNSELRYTLPNGRTAAGYTQGTCTGADNGVKLADLYWQVTTGNTYVQFFTSVNAANWTLSTDLTQVRCTITARF